MNEQILDIQSKSIEQMKSLQSQALEMNERVAEAMQRFVPEVPELPGPFAELPTPSELVNNYFEYMTQVSEANREFVQNMMAAWSEEPAKKAPAKKAAAKK